MTTKIPKSIEIIRTNFKLHSSLSQVSAEAMHSTLSKFYEDVRITMVDNVMDLEKLAFRNPDLVFTGMRTIPGVQTKSRVWVSTYLELNNIRHTGSSQKALVFEQDKPHAKQQVMSHGLKSSSFIVIKNGVQYLDRAILLNFPLFVKPTSSCGGTGVDQDSVIHDHQDLRAKTAAIARNFASDSLVEEYLSGREFCVAVLQEEFSDELIAMPVELLSENNLSGDKILSHDIKSANKDTAVAVTDPELRAGLVALATGAFKALGASGYGTIDIRLSADGTPHFLEANLIPSLIDKFGSFAKACVLNMDMDYEDMMLHIVRLGLSTQTSTPSTAAVLI